MSASGPLVARWRTLERVQIEAGALRHVTVEVENAGTAAWRTRGAEEGLFLAYHWLDKRGNPIVWDGRRTPLERTVEPGATLRQAPPPRAPPPPRPYPPPAGPRRGTPLPPPRPRHPPPPDGP